MFVHFFLFMNIWTVCSFKEEAKVDLNQLLSVLKILKTHYDQLKNNVTDLTKTVAELKKENVQIKTACKCGATTTNSSNVNAKKPTPTNSSIVYAKKPTPTNSSTVDAKKLSPNNSSTKPTPTKSNTVKPTKQVLPVVPAATNSQPAQLRKAVGFTAALTSVISLGQHQPVEYDKVITNVGKGFDARHGHFVAPVKGLYILSATILNSEGKEMHMEMVKNGVQLVAFYADPDDYSMGSQTIVLSLKANDMVWIRHCRVKRPSPIYGKPDQPINTFSGALIVQFD
ncbi:caprin-2-like [Mytilus californianus]|uniref:caprin-2-like n=1 Tax=Mytilus californianus TaxID=6549 RepID=UPI00224636B2|nr:caprin-2-like [Mytilus californianus]